MKIFVVNKIFHLIFQNLKYTFTNNTSALYTPFYRKNINGFPSELNTFWLWMCLYAFGYYSLGYFSTNYRNTIIDLSSGLYNVWLAVNVHRWKDYIKYSRTCPANFCFLIETCSVQMHNRVFYVLPLTYKLYVYITCIDYAYTKVNGLKTCRREHTCLRIPKVYIISWWKNIEKIYRYSKFYRCKNKVMFGKI